MNEIVVTSGSLQTIEDVSGVCRGCRWSLRMNCQLPDAKPYLRVCTTNPITALQNQYAGAGCDLVVLYGAEVKKLEANA